MQQQQLRSSSRSGCVRPATAAAATLRRPLPAPPRGRAASVAARAFADVDPSVATAVAQQAVAYAVVLAGEAAFSRSQLPAGDPGCPQVPVVAGGVAGSVGAAALLKAGAGSAGIAVGLASTGLMVAAAVLRAVRLETLDDDWPGPRAWPAGLALLSFFAFMSFVQTALLPAV